MRCALTMPCTRGRTALQARQPRAGRAGTAARRRRACGAPERGPWHAPGSARSRSATWPPRARARAAGTRTPAAARWCPRPAPGRPAARLSGAGSRRRCWVCASCSGEMTFPSMRRARAAPPWPAPGRGASRADGRGARRGRPAGRAQGAAARWIIALALLIRFVQSVSRPVDSVSPAGGAGAP